MEEADANLRAAERVVELLERHGLPAVVIGAMALAAYGYVRHTEDIDLGVNADGDKMREMADVLRGEGFDVELREAEGDDPLGGVMDVRGAFGLVQIVNFGERFPAVIRDALAGEAMRVQPSGRLRVVPLPQLVALKLYAGGMKSLVDVVELLRRNPGEDLEVISVLCQRYRLPGFQQVLRELDAPE